jgi:hypothetical protein
MDRTELRCNATPPKNKRTSAVEFLSINGPSEMRVCQILWNPDEFFALVGASPHWQPKVNARSEVRYAREENVRYIS